MRLLWQPIAQAWASIKAFSGDQLNKSAAELAGAFETAVKSADDLSWFKFLRSARQMRTLLTNAKTNLGESAATTNYFIALTQLTDEVAKRLDFGEIERAEADLGQSVDDMVLVLEQELPIKKLQPEIDELRTLINQLKNEISNLKEKDSFNINFDNSVIKNEFNLINFSLLSDQIGGSIGAILGVIANLNTIVQKIATNEKVRKKIQEAIRKVLETARRLVDVVGNAAPEKERSPKLIAVKEEINQALIKSRESDQYWNQRIASFVLVALVLGGCNLYWLSRENSATHKVELLCAKIGELQTVDDRPECRGVAKEVQEQLEELRRIETALSALNVKVDTLRGLLPVLKPFFVDASTSGQLRSFLQVAYKSEPNDSATSLMRAQAFLEIAGPHIAPSQLRMLEPLLVDESSLRKFDRIYQAAKNAKPTDPLGILEERFFLGTSGVKRPDVIYLRETEGYAFKTSSAEVEGNFKQLISNNIVPRLKELAQENNYNIIEVIGHTDDQTFNEVVSNLDEMLRQVLFGGKSVSELKPSDNAGLAFARAVAVTKMLREGEGMKSFKILPLSAAQLVGADEQITHNSRGNDKGLRRIEIRLRGSQEIVGDYRSSLQGR